MSRRGAFVAVVLLCGFAACNDEPTPNIPDPTPSSTGPSVSESVTPTTPTETADVLTPEATVRAWVAAWNQALRSGETAGIHTFEASDCRNCSNLSKVIDDVAEAGGSFTGGDWSIVSLKAQPDGERVKVNVAVKVGAGSTINAAGEEPVEYDADKRIVVYQLREEPRGWIIDVVEVIS
jgi:hypothetical protein